MQPHSLKTPNRKTWPKLAMLVLLGASALAGCRRDEPYHASVAKAPAAMGQPAQAEVNNPEAAPAEAAAGQQLPPGHPPMGEGQPGAQMGGQMPPPGMQGDVPPPPEVAPGSALKWKLPNGWTEQRTGGIRYATLKPAAGNVDVSIVVLSGSAGGELANVNRWRGQLGLAPIDDAALAASRKTITAKAGAINLYDFETQGDPKSRMVAGLLSANGSTWFVKMVGDGAAVGAARGDFVKILETLSFE